MGKKVAGSGVKATVNGTVITWTGAGQTVSWNVAHATPGLVLSPLAQAAILNGFRVAGDRMTALERDPTTKASPSVADKLARVKARVDAWVAGEWAIGRTGGPRQVDPRLIELAMVRALSGVNSVDDVKRITAKQIAAGKADGYEAALNLWAATAQVKAAIKQIEAERLAASSNLDAEAMLAGLMGEDDGEDGPDDEGDGDSEDGEDDLPPV